jgi:hypothetical protein
MAVASHQPNTRINCGGAEAATVVAEAFSGESMDEIKLAPEQPDDFPVGPELAKQ